jgi:hypothetical protein
MVDAQKIRDVFYYDGAAERFHRGYHMRGALVRRDGSRPPRCGTLTPKAPDARATVWVPGEGHYPLHRAIWMWHHGDPPQGFVIDHADRDPSNNRVENLRAVPKARNGLNLRAGRSSGKVPYIGVSPYGSHGKYRAYLEVDGSRKHIGCFSNPIDAALARDAEAERRAPGFASLNRDLFPEVRSQFHLKTQPTTT